MPLRAYLILMSIGTAIAWAGWLFVVITIDPNEAGILSLILFYITLFVSLMGSLAILGIIFRVRWRKSNELLTREVKISFRHAVMLSAVGIVSLLLASLDLLTWWNFLALFIGVGVVEYLFLLSQQGRRT